jgi:hypothetical protein
MMDEMGVDEGMEWFILPPQDPSSSEEEEDEEEELEMPPMTQNTESAIQEGWEVGREVSWQRRLYCGPARYDSYLPWVFGRMKCSAENGENGENGEKGMLFDVEELYERMFSRKRRKMDALLCRGAVWLYRTIFSRSVRLGTCTSQIACGDIIA